MSDQNEVTIEKKVIILKRREKKLEILPEIVTTASRARIGAQLRGRAPMSPLSYDQEEKILPNLIGTSPSDPDWRKKVTNYWNEFYVDVPHSGGLIIDVSVKKEGKKVSPVNLRDWITYKWLKEHTLVADNEEEMVEKNLDYYLYDDELEEKKENIKGKQINRSIKLYTELISDSNDTRLDHVIWNLVESNPKNLTREQKENRIQTVALKDPKKFIDVVGDPRLGMRAQILEFLEFGILNRVGNNILNDAMVIGEDMEEAILYLESKANSGVLVKLRSKLEAMKSNSEINI